MTSVPDFRAERRIDPGEFDPVPAGHAAAPALDLRRIFTLLARNAVAIAAIVAACLALGALVTVLTVPRYVATSRVLIEQQTDQIIEGSDVTPSSGYQDADRFLTTQVDVLASRSLAKRVVQALNLSEDSRYFAALDARFPQASDLPPQHERSIKATRSDAAADLLQRNLRLNLPRESRLVAISFESVDPIYSAKLANAVADEYIESNLGRKFESSSYARRFLAQQLDDTRAKLEQSERALNQYSRAAGLIRITGRGQDGAQDSALSITNDSLVQLNAAAGEATAERMAAENRWNTIATVPALSIPQVLANPAIQDLIRQKSAVEGQLAQERARHLDEYPSVAALRAQIARIDAQMAQIAGAIRSSVRLEYAAARDKERTLRAQVAKLQGTALSEQDRGVQYNILKRVAETNRSLYDSLLSRYNELNATAGSAANNVFLVDQAEVPKAPSSPSLTRNLGIALLLSLVLATAFVFVRDHFDDMVRAPGDVEAKLGLPLLGVVPQTQGDALETVRNDVKSAIAEAYQALVTTLRYSTPQGLPRTLAVTSAQESEGKSTSAIALAINLARVGRTVILIDADLRRPTLHKRAGIPQGTGLADLLVAQGSLSEALQVSAETPDLSYITAGGKPPEPSLLLGGGQLGQIIADARDRADIVIVDCPPMLGLSDTAIISAHVDAVLFVVDSTKSHHGAAKSALRRLQLVQAHLLGAVLTKFNPKLAGKEYSYYGYNYYSYGHADQDRA